MITSVLPLTSFRLRILCHIYEQGGSHIRDLQAKLRLHLHSVQKAVEKLKPLLSVTEVGSTNLLRLDSKKEGYLTLLYILEDYRNDTAPGETQRIMLNTIHVLEGHTDVLCACIFGSHARGTATQKSDVDILVILKRKDPALLQRLAQLSALFGKEVNPLLLTEEELSEGLEKGEPTLLSLREPLQRYLLVGKEYFLTYLPPPTQ